MKTTKTNKVALNDQSLPARQAKNVKGGFIWFKQGAQNFTNDYSAQPGLLVPGPHVITAAGPGAGPHQPGARKQDSA